MNRDDVMESFTGDQWRRANRALVAKSLAELCYEQALRAEEIAEGSFSVFLDSGVDYRFHARRTLWDWLQIEVDSVERIADGRAAAAVDAAQFFIDAGTDLELRPETLGNLLHETANTLAADVALLAARGDRSARELARVSDEKLQCLLDGHPKAVVNKGRIGWGSDEFARFGTEAARGVRLLWLAVDKDESVCGRRADWSWEQLIAQSLDEEQREQLAGACRERGISWGDYLPLPVHPWQWQRHIRHHYTADIAEGRIRYLGEFGDSYLPQVSLRTLSNLRQPAALHIKLPLTVLNTSCYRGIPGQYMQCGPDLSVWMDKVCKGDPQLRVRSTGVLQEIAGLHVPHRHHEQVAGTPYRYREMLGVTWRESPAGKCAPGERHLLMAALLQCDAKGHSVAAALIDESGLDAETWLAQLFDAAVVPLYHLLCRYGVGLVAHSQNLTLVLRGGRVQRVLLKDFQGDLRLAEGEFPERDHLPASASAVLTQLPPHYLIHDLYTGHFVTVLRYFSAQLLREIGLSELEFYRVLALTLRNYQAQVQQELPQMRERFALFDLFRPEMPRVCINRVRLRQGYGDSAERPVPIVGGDLQNPLWLAEQSAGLAR